MKSRILGDDRIMNINKKATERLLTIILLSTLVFVISTLGWGETDIIYYAIGIVVSGSLIGICGCILVLIVDSDKK